LWFDVIFVIAQQVLSLLSDAIFFVNALKTLPMTLPLAVLSVYFTCHANAVIVCQQSSNNLRQQIDDLIIKKVSFRCSFAN
jgi:hypothetical protein